MDSTIARWEWRTFDTAFEATERQLAPTLTPPVTSHEIYVLRAGSDLNVKIRRAWLEVKSLQHVSAEGLEQWMPALKAPFPVDASAVSALYRAWRAAPPVILRPAYDETGFLRELIEPNPRLSAVRVTKTRRTGKYEGCLVEIADLALEDAATRTLAIESEDPDRVLAVLDVFGLSAHDNVNYVRALTQFVSSQAARARTDAQEAPRHAETPTT